jgi:Holliday junction resolvase RusA-like endonuclease
MKVILYWRIPSKKNSKQIVMRGKYPKLLSSKAYLEWEKWQIPNVEWLRLKTEAPYCMTCDFYLPDLRKADLSNKFESIADMLVKAWVLQDDNYTILSEVHLAYRWLDRENPRVEIEIT